jgi:hypothetical protein
MGCPILSAFVAEGWEAKILTGRGGYLLFGIFNLAAVTEEYRIYAKKTRFLARSMKTKGLFSRYPRKISLLKDLREGGYPGPYRLVSYLKHGAIWGYLPKYPF